MNHTYNHPQAHVSGAFRPGLVPTKAQTAAPTPGGGDVRVTPEGNRRITTNLDVRVVG